MVLSSLLQHFRKTGGMYAANCDSECGCVVPRVGDGIYDRVCATERNEEPGAAGSTADSDSSRRCGEEESGETNAGGNGGGQEVVWISLRDVSWKRWRRKR